MKIKSLVRLATIVLPVGLSGCTGVGIVVNALERESPPVVNLTATPYERGKQQFSDGRYGLAKKYFESALEQDLDSIEVLNALAASYDHLARFDQAERYYLRALSIDPVSRQTLNNLGYSYLMQRRYDVALTYLREAQDLDPTDSLVASNLQMAEAGLGIATLTFAASPMDPGGLEQLASGSRSTVMRMGTNPTAVEPVSDVVHIKAVATRDDLWVERTGSGVQTLITQPSAEILLAAREAGIPLHIGNYKAESALSALAIQPTPWETTRAMIGEVVFYEGPDEAALHAPLFAEAQLLSAAIIGAVSDKMLDADAIEAASEELPPIMVPAQRVAGRGVPAEQDLLAESEAIAEVPFEGPAQDGPAAPPDSDETPFVKVSEESGWFRMAYRASDFLAAQDMFIIP
jgi:tetratricopeptide (TPR) repeat protein